MQINYHKKFIRSYNQRIATNPNLVKRVVERIELFKNDSMFPILRDHALKGDAEGYRSFSITGDIRVIYVRISEDEVTSYDIGTHNQVY